MKILSLKSNNSKVFAPSPETTFFGPSSKLSVSWRGNLLALLIFIGLTLWLLWPVVARVDQSLEQWGDALLQTWTLDWDAYALRHNPLELFNANAFYPYNNSLAFSESLIGQAFLVTPLIWLTNNPVLAFNLLLLLSFVLSGWGMYLLTYALTRSWAAGIIAGIIFAFFPNRFSQLSHLHLLATQWMPFCLLFLRRYLQNWKWRNGLLFALLLTLELLSSTYLGLFLVVVVGLYLLYRGIIFLTQSRKNAKIYQELAGEAGAENKTRLKFPKIPGFTVFIVKPLLMLVLAGLVALPFLWPYLEVQRDLGFERSPAEVISWSAQPFYYLDVPKENKLNQWLYRAIFNQGWWQSSAGGERSQWLGVLAWLLAIGGVFAAWKRRKQERDGLFYFGLAVLAISFTFGPGWQTGRFGTLPLPYALLYNYVPGFQGLRVPVRFIYVAALGVAILAGFGVAALQNRFKLFSLPKIAALTIGLSALLCLEYASDVSVNESNILRADAPPASKWLAAHPGPSLNVPLSGSDNSNLFYQYWTREAWSPIMNGFSGFMPPAYDALKAAVNADGFSPRIISLLQGLEVRYIVVDSEDDTLRPRWNKLKNQLEQAGSEAARFGGTYIYALKQDDWLRRLNLTPDKALEFIEYRRNDSPLLELIAYYTQRTNLSKRENLFGNIRIAFRQLPALPANQPADMLFLQAGEDPVLYGFRAEDKILGNTLLEVYKRSPKLLARSDFGASSGLTGPTTVRARSNAALEFSNELRPRPGLLKEQYLRLTFAALKPQTVTINNGVSGGLTLGLEPGVSTVEFPAGEDSVFKLEAGEVRLLIAELWQGVPAQSGKLNLRQDIVLLEAQGLREAENGLARLKVVPRGGSGEYTATLDIYNYPWGTHPNGHYGYWSVPLKGNSETNLEYKLDLTQKSVTTRLNGSDIPNFPPDPKQFDITKYGKFGDFRASFNLYAGDKLIGSVRLFDFTIYAQGDKNRAENRRIGAFTGYNTNLIMLVLPPGK